LVVGGIMEGFDLYRYACNKLVWLLIEAHEFIKRDIRRLVYMLKPIEDVDNGKKLYREVDFCDDHDGRQYCIFCEDVTETATVCAKDTEDKMKFCSKCGFELTAYDMESE
jgi:hypothetical protein